MAIKLHEVHPSLVHFPIALFPVALGADTVGWATGSKSLLKVGKWGMLAAVGSAGLAALAGLVAQTETRQEGRARDYLVTHRNLNAAFMTLATELVRRRLFKRRPSLGYLATGYVTLATMVYATYFGGKMVYEHGVGVRAADGIRPGHAPEIVPGRGRAVARHAMADARQGAFDAVEQLARGEIAPALLRGEHPLSPEVRGGECPPAPGAH